ncbi:DNA-directed RNA polymerase subunit beta [Candidatus Vidania fulgoroideorum]
MFIINFKSSKNFINDFSKLKGLLSFQKNSFLMIFKKGCFSLDNFFRFYFPIKSKDKKVSLDFISYEVLKCKNSVTNCRENSLTYSYKLYLNLRFIFYNKNINFESKIFVCEIPCMLKNGSFLINGIERTLVSGITRAPGCYFFFKKDIRIIQIIPNCGFRMEIIRDNNDNIYYSIDGGKYIKIKKLLNIFNIDNKSIFEKKFSESLILLKKKKFFISVNKSLIKNKKKLFLIKKKYYSKIKKNKNIFVIKKYKSIKKETMVKIKNIKEKNVKTANIFINKKENRNKYFKKYYYSLSKIGRERINEKLCIVGNKNKFIDSYTIIVIIKRILNSSYFFQNLDNIDDIKNKRLLTCGEIIFLKIKKGFSFIKNSLTERIYLIDSISKIYIINFNIVNSQIKELFYTSGYSQFLEQTNILSEITHKRRISFIKDSKTKVSMSVRDVNNSYYGFICPIETPEGPSIGLVNSLSIFCKVEKYGFLKSPFIYNNKLKFKKSIEEKKSIINESMKKFGKIRMQYYKNKNKIKIGGFKKKIIDLYPSQFASIAANCIPFFNHNDANRALMGSNMQRQALSCINSSKPYIITGIEKSISENLFYSIKSSLKGTVNYVDSKYIIIVSKVKIKIYELEKYSKTNQNTLINYKPKVNIGDKIKKNDLIAESLNTIDNILSIGRNLLVAFMPWEGYNFEDSIVISEKVIRKDYFTSIYIEKFSININNDDLITSKIPNINNIRKRNLKNGIIKIGSYVKSNDILVGKLSFDKDITFSPEEKLINNIFNKKNTNFYNCSLKVPDGISGKVINVEYLNGKEKKIKNPKNIKNFLKNISNFNIFSKKSKFKKIVVTIVKKRKLRIGDKMSGRHGNKGVIAKILPEYEMPFTKNGVPCDIILNPLSISSRMNIGQIIETKLGLIIFVIKLKLKYFILKNKIDDLKKIIYVLYKKKFKKNKDVIFFSKKIIKNIIFEINPFNNIKKKIRKISRIIFDNKIRRFLSLDKSNEKLDLINPKNGEILKKISFGYMYYLKLYHMVDNKIHARSIGPYSLITQQPLKGKSNFGGQRLGEMEVWALEAYGAANTIIEMITVKSDDVKGRTNMYKNIINNKDKFSFYKSESFITLIKEINSLGIEVITNE